jgi:hypothetical protein
MFSTISDSFKTLGKCFGQSYEVGKAVDKGGIN